MRNKIIRDFIFKAFYKLPLIITIGPFLYANEQLVRAIEWLTEAFPNLMSFDGIISVLSYIPFFSDAWCWLIVPTPAMVLVALALPFAKKTDVITYHHGQRNVQRYRLPSWAWFMESPDEHLPGGLYEPTVDKIYRATNWRVTAWWWLTVRNVGHAPMWKYALEVSDYFHKLTDTEKTVQGVWRKYKTVLWIFELRYGWWVYKDNYGEYSTTGFVAVPHITLRLKRQD